MVANISALGGSRAARYSTVAIVLHWLIGALLLFEVGLGLRMVDAHGAARFASFQLHKSVGITILLLIVLRLVWRLRRTPPPLVHSGWERTLAHSVHVLFYLLLFALPLSGWLIVSSSRIVVPTLLYGAIPWPHLPGFATMAVPLRDAWHSAGIFIHHNGVNVIYALFAMHLAGVAKHQFLDRDADLARMAPGVAAGAWRDPRVIAIVLGGVIAVGLGLQWLPLGTSAKPAALAPQAAPARLATVDALPSTPKASAPLTIPQLADAAPAPKPDIVNQTVSEVSAGWKIAQGSSLRFTTRFSGDAVEGSFEKFDGEISFDPDHLDKAHVEIRIPVASAVTGDAQRDETLKSADWFAAASFGTAVFKADRFRKLGGDRYLASGTLQIKGTTLPVSMPFTLTILGDKASMTGTATVNRTAYKIGEGEYATTDDIPAGVAVTVAVKATRVR